MDPAKPIRPSLWHLLWGVPFLLAGIGLFAYALIHGITHATDSLTQIVVPGSAELTLKPGSYTVFLEEQSVVDGKVYSTKQSVDGLTCRARSTPGGATIPISQSTTNTTYTVNGRSGHSVLQFPIQTGGKYNFACDYGKDGTGPQVVIAVGSGVGEAIMRTVIDGLASFFGGAAAALVIVFIVVLTRERNKKRLRQSALFPNTGQPWSSVTPHRQSLLYKNGHSYDQMDVKSVQDGSEHTFYFNTDIPIKEEGF